MSSEPAVHLRLVDEPACLSQASFSVAVSVTNDSSEPLLIFHDPKMPYVTVVGPTEVRLGSVICAMAEGANRYGVSCPRTVTLASGARWERTVSISLPLRSSDHLTAPRPSPVVLARTFTVHFDVGLSPAPIDGRYLPGYAALVRAQRIVTSNTITVHLEPHRPSSEVNHG